MLVDQSMFELISGWKTWTTAAGTMMLAILLWGIQIPSLVTPGSLSTGIDVRLSYAPTLVSEARMCQFGYAIRDPDNGLDTANLTETGCYAYYDVLNDKTNSGLNRVIWGTSFAGQIPELESPCKNSNCSYSLEYMAPTLKCGRVQPPSTPPHYLVQGGAYLPRNYTDPSAGWQGQFFLAFAGTTSQIAGPNLYFNMTLLTGIEPVEYGSHRCLFYNTSMKFNFSFSDHKNSQVTLARPPLYLNELNLTAALETPLSSSALTTYWTGLTGLFTGLVQGMVDQSSWNIYDASGGTSSIGGTSSGPQSSQIFSAARDTSLRRYIYTGPDRAPAGYDPSATGNAGTALEELSRNVSVAMTQL